MLNRQSREGDGAPHDREGVGIESRAQERVGPPAVSLPKGGGALKGIGEKFAANPVTGTGSLNVPLNNSPGRSDFGPQLALSYDSGAGNGPFGVGWHVSLPQITRKTEKGLPRYEDADESDVFILSGAEDLVPVLGEVGGQWTRHTFNRTRDGNVYRVEPYRPRVEGLFARIERWVNPADPSDTFWRTVSKENVTTLYGRSQESRIADPSDPARIFNWLICESYDDKGNAALYRYKAEDSTALDTAQAHEQNRTDLTRSANRYLKRVNYCNDAPRQAGEDLSLRSDWLFEVVFDYGEHDDENPTPNDSGSWLCRHDPFSSYRAGFEVRTYRLCRRVLMFHHFPAEQGVGADCLVRSTDLLYRSDRQNPADFRQGHPVASFIAAITQQGYKRRPDGSYLKQSMPPLELEYSRAVIDEEVRELDPQSVENLPVGLDGARYEWVDLDGEGASGVLTRQAGAWFYKRNLGPLTSASENNREPARAAFAPVELASRLPAAAGSGRQQLLDLAGDGRLELAQFDRPLSGFYERTPSGDWAPFVAFESVPNLAWDDPNLKFIDLTGDGHADILVSEDEVFVWYPSRGEAGFGAARHVRQTLEEEDGPRLVFADGTESVYLADLSGDGLTDLVRVRNGEVCYWPSLGYGRFGAKVTMENAPRFDAPDQFDQKRIRLADIDGSGATDILYLGRDGVQIYFNQSGNGWAEEYTLRHFPRLDDASAVLALDLHGNGTACLVWSSSLAADAGRPMRYVDLLGGRKPHLLVRSVNNLGAETHVHYAPSTRFYLQDELAGRPWITRIPFPVHVVERVETFDRVGRNRFVTRYAYHHGYFDGDEREFRGFGMVEQWDTEEFESLTNGQPSPGGANVELASHVPPVLTRTWFHTGVYVGREHVSNFFAGLLDSEDAGEYYREPGLSDAQARSLLLDDTTLPVGLDLDEEREACRALKGAVLRREVYALDGSDKEPHPYTVTEQNFTIRTLQPRAGNRHGVFFTHARETINYHYERNPADPRITHALTLDVDRFGNVLKSAAVGYGRRQADAALSPADAEKQTRTLITYIENLFTNAIDADDADDRRGPLACESRTYELTGYLPSGANGRFRFSDFIGDAPGAPALVFDGEVEYEVAPGAGRRRRLIERVRTYYRRNDLTARLPLGELESLALPYEAYRLAFTPGLLSNVYQRPRDNQPAENLLPDAAVLLGGTGADRGGYVELDGDGHWWAPAGRVFYALNVNVADEAATAAAEAAEARGHFFLPRQFFGPFGHGARVDYRHDLLIGRTEDALGNVVQAVNDWRVLQPRLVTDANGNRSEVVFDALGMVVGTALMGKTTENLGDSLVGFAADLTTQQTEDFFNADDPHVPAPALLGDATTRLVYDLNQFRRTAQAHPDDPHLWLPPCVATLARETHASEPLPPNGLRVQISFSYSDGFGREVQRKVEAEPGPLVEGGPNVSPRWVGTGWTVFNNKGNPVRRYEPFFSRFEARGHRFEFGVQFGVSPVIFYDPLGRAGATLHPHHAFEKVVFDPWRKNVWGVNDAVLLDPRADDDIRGFTGHYFAAPGNWQTWYERRQGGALGAHEQSAAVKAAAHAGTPTETYFDTLGRAFLTVANNGPDAAGHERKYGTRVNLDIENNQREVTDARGRTVMRYDYDMLGNLVRLVSMDAGARWLLKDVMGGPIRSWDSRGHDFRTEYDQLRRPLRRFVRGADPAHSDPRTLGQERLFEQTVYGEGQPNDIALNLRTRVLRQYDGAGVVTNMGHDPFANTDEAYDFKGNLLSSRRQFAQNYSALPDWSAAVPLGADVYEGRTTFDALNRPLTLSTPDASVVRPIYNAANLLEAVEVNLRGEQANGQPVWAPFVTGIDYDARGQRTLIRYGNGAETSYVYDPETFRLVHLYTRRGTAFTDDCGGDPPPRFAAPAQPPGALRCGLQNLRYTYDPAGNVTHVRDDAQQTVYFNNHRVEPHCDYTYDALYRLIEATGREHLGQNAAGGSLPPSPASPHEGPSAAIPDPRDGRAMGAYRRQYVYDEVGNPLEVIHRGTDPQHPGWTRTYTYLEESLLEPGEQSNRLTSTGVGAAPETYSANGDGYDPHGNMLRLPHLQLMQWDFKDHLSATQRQAVNAGQGERTFYVYDAAGRRARKVTESAPGQVREERFYLGGFEIYRQQGPNPLTRETLHVMDGEQRVALVETRTRGQDAAPAQLTRYQFADHLGSSGLELNQQAQVISYEEYYPYGGTSYRAAGGGVEVSRKRYRYVGKERDEESGLDFYGARYYAPWLARWTSTDPAGTADGPNLYLFVRANPVNGTDPGGTQTLPTQAEVRAIANEIQDSIRETIGRGSIKGLDVDHLVSVDKLYADYGKRLTADQWRKLFSETGELYGLVDESLNRSKGELSFLEYFGSRNPGIGGLTEAEIEHAQRLTHEARDVFAENVKRIQVDPNVRLNVGGVEGVAGLTRNRVVQTASHTLGAWGSTPASTTSIRKNTRGRARSAGIIGGLLALVGLTAFATQAGAAEEPPVELPNEEGSIREKNLAQSRVGARVAQEIGGLPGSEFGEVFAIGLSLQGTLSEWTRKTAVARAAAKFNALEIHNLPYVFDRSSGTLYRITIDGELSPEAGSLKRNIFGFYTDGSYTVYQNQDQNWYLGKF